MVSSLGLQLLLVHACMHACVLLLPSPLRASTPEPAGWQLLCCCLRAALLSPVTWAELSSRQ